jgi:hypothetical protein
VQNDATEVGHEPPSPGVTLWSHIRRLIAGAYWVIGGIANLLGIYAFGESRNWWVFSFYLSPEMGEVLWMLAVGLGGPWALMLGVWAGARFSELFTKDKAQTASLVSSVVDISFFLSIWHSAQMALGLKIFSRYLYGGGFVKVISIYLLVGLALGAIWPLITRKFKRRPTQAAPADQKASLPGR